MNNNTTKKYTENTFFKFDDFIEKNIDKKNKKKKDRKDKSIAEFFELCKKEII